MFGRLLYQIALFFRKWPKWALFGLLGLVLVAPFIGIIGAKFYETWDYDRDQASYNWIKNDGSGATAALDPAQVPFGENIVSTEYLDQGWQKKDSLWFYNTTQGSAFLPYDFLLALEQPDYIKKSVNRKIVSIENDDTSTCSTKLGQAKWFICPRNIDRYRYIPQNATFSNPDALPVGFVKESYRGKDYVGLTCAACHTGQVVLDEGDVKKAIRIDGGPAMADMVKFLTELTAALAETKRLPDAENPKLERFVKNVLELGSYKSRQAIEDDLTKWAQTRQWYNQVNHSSYNNIDVDYGFGRLDAFGRIFNRVLQYAISRDQLNDALSSILVWEGTKSKRLLTGEQVRFLMDGVGKAGDIILQDKQFGRLVENMSKPLPGRSKLSERDLKIIRSAIFNSANAPVSYPVLWDITRSDFVQWNALASNAGLGPLGRNAGEVVGVFGILDWKEDDSIWTKIFNFSLTRLLSGQSNKSKFIDFTSSIDLFNLRRIEGHLSSLVSPKWPFCQQASSGKYYLPTGNPDVPVDKRPCAAGDTRLNDGDDEYNARLVQGRGLYRRFCQECHNVIQRDAFDRQAIGHSSGILKDYDRQAIMKDNISLKDQATDPAMALNSVRYKGYSGNFQGTYQDEDVGKFAIGETAPAIITLTAATKGVIASRDPDKWAPRRLVDWVYTLVASLRSNTVKATPRVGDYAPDNTANPFNSLLAYRARPLNGIWASAPYLHNGSVPTLYDLLLPATSRGPGCADGKSRPKTFVTGSREFDPVRVGLKHQNYDGFVFDTSLRGNSNRGHEYGACLFSEDDRMNLLEYLKTL